MKKRLVCLLLLLIPVLASFPAFGQEAAPKTVALLPFTVHADRDMSFLRAGLYDMLASRLSWEGRVAMVSRAESFKAAEAVKGPLDEKAALAVGKELSADYVLFGSVTSLGEAVSIDATVLPVSGTGSPQSFSRAAESLGKVIPAVNELCAEINFSVFGRGEFKAAAPVEAPQGRANPEQSYRRETGQTAAGTSPVSMAAGGGPAKDFWISQTFSTALMSLCMADVDGDKADETVTADSDAVWAYRYVSGRLAGICSYKVGKYIQILWLDAADLDGDGKAEVYVSALDTNGQSLVSFVLVFDGKAFQVKAQDQPWYFRVLSVPGRGKVLYGQRRGVSDLYLPGVTELVMEGGKYAAKGAAIPRAGCIFGVGLGRFTGADQQGILILDDAGDLRLYSDTGEKVYKSDESYGGSEKYMRVPDPTTNQNVSYLPQRLIVTDVSGGAQGALVVKNEGTTGRLLGRFRMFTSGRFDELAWNGLGLTPVWSTAKISGLITDYGLGDVDGDGVTELVVAVVKKGMTKDQSNIIAYDFK
ncbi:MAG: FG-GAP-like repeat-containing protein [Thermodesulfobacteriota bacterium]